MIKIGFLASHGGSGMRAVLEAMDNGLEATATVLICNNQNAAAFALAKHHNIPSYHLSGKTHPDPEMLDRAICTTLRKHAVDLVMLSGYMKLLGPVTLQAYRNRILNIHPALLPKFGGRGMYGDRVHRAVIDNQEVTSGASVHIVTAEYDQGPVLNQQQVQLEKDETVTSLREKIKKLEGKLYVETLKKIISGEITLPS